MREIIHSFIGTVNRYNDFYSSLEMRKRDFGGTELYPSEIHTLVMIKESSEMNFTQLAQALGITKGAFTKTVSKLLAKNLVEKRFQKDNRKSICYLLTPLGMAAYEAHTAFHAQADFKVPDEAENFFKENRETILKTFSYVNEIIAGLGALINTDGAGED